MCNDTIPQHFDPEKDSDIHAGLYADPHSAGFCCGDFDYVQNHAGSVFRRASKATLLFADGHTGEADWRRYGGEAQPEDQRILLRLSEGDRVGYRLENPENQKIRIHVRSYGDGILDVQDLTAGQGLVWITCKSGTADVESLHIRAADDSAETI